MRPSGLATTLFLFACQERASNVSTANGTSFPVTVDLGAPTQLWEPKNGYVRIDALAVAADGRVAVYDAGASTMYVVAADGTSGRVVGGHGAGPGELGQVSAVAFLSDGRLVARDFILSRLAVFSPEYAPVGHIPVPPSELMGQRALRVVRGSNVLIGTTGPRRGKFETSSFSYQAVDSLKTGNEHVDLPPDVAEECAVEYMEGEPRVKVGKPEPQLSVLASGSTVVACASSGRLELRRTGKPTQKLVVPSVEVPLTEQERSESRASFAALMQREVPGWTWRGPDVPRTHPPFRQVFAGDDGTVWLKTPRPSTRCAREDRCAWRVRSGLSLYDTTGVLVAEINVPLNFSFRTDPVLTSRSIVSVILDESDVPHLAKFAVPPRAGSR